MVVCAELQVHASSGGQVELAGPQHPVLGHWLNQWEHAGETDILLSSKPNSLPWIDDGKCLGQVCCLYGCVTYRKCEYHSRLCAVLCQ